MIETAQFQRRRHRVATCLPLGEGVLVVGAGKPIPLPENTDQLYPYRAHADYYYLAGMEAPGAVICYDPAWGPDDGWVSFVPTVTEDERIWEGREQLPGRPLKQFREWLEKRGTKRICNLGARLGGVPSDQHLEHTCGAALLQARRKKDNGEIELLEQAAAATAAGFRQLTDFAPAGVSERDVQIELEAAFFRHGANRTGYDTIVGAGSNAAVLHFPPGGRVLRDGDFLLVDAGAEVSRYVCDVTRTYVVGRPSAFQHDLYQIVLDTETEAIERCRPGVEWRDVHLAAANKLTEGLVAMGVMRGKPQNLVEQAAHMLFFPHGIGHMVGLGVRDASGVAPGRKRSTDPALRHLRCDFPLEAGYVMTVEPGLYFIPPLLNDPARRERFRDAVNWDLVDQHQSVGGVRIEDNVLITDADEPTNLTAAIPKDLTSLPV